MPFKILYTLFLIACFFYPFEYVIGSVAIRHIISWVLLIMLFFKKQLKFDWVIWAFVVYLFFFVIASVATGYLVEFFPTLIGTYITCIIMYLATKTMMKEGAGEWILYTLLSIAVIDSVVTIAQFFNHPIARTIADALRVNLIDEDAWAMYDTYGGGIGGIVSGGLLRGVKNGYFLCSAVILSLINKANRINLVNVILCIVLFAALFFTQERAAFFLGVLCLVVFIILGVMKKRQKTGVLVFIAAIIAIVALSNLMSYIDIGETRYAVLGRDFAGRESFWKNTFDYVAINPLGGSYAFYDTGGYPPHNFIPNSYLNGGFIGGTVVVLLVFFQLYYCFKILYEAWFKKKHSMPLVALALIYIGYTGNSCFHNLCLATGDETAFMWWAMISFLLQKEAIETKHENVGILSSANK